MDKLLAMWVLVGVPGWNGDRSVVCCVRGIQAGQPGNLQPVWFWGKVFEDIA